MIVKRAVRDRKIQEWRKAWDAWINDPAQANLKYADFPLLPGEMTPCRRHRHAGHRQNRVGDGARADQARL
jgi:hypothetical protein